MKKFGLAVEKPAVLLAVILIIPLCLVGCQGTPVHSAVEIPTAKVPSSIPYGASATNTMQPIPTTTGTFTPLPSPTNTVFNTATFTLSPTPEGMLYANSFSGLDESLSDWIIHEEVDTRHFQFDGPYTFDLPRRQGQIIDGGDGQIVYAIYDMALPTSDLVIEEEMEFVGEGSASQMLICRYSEAGWYEMSLGSSGQWEIRLVRIHTDNGITTTTLAQGDTEGIKHGANLVEGSCADNKISLMVNGAVVAAVQDTSLPEGNLVGLAYLEDTPAAIHLEINKFSAVAADGRTLIDLSVDKDSFYFAWRTWATSTGIPKNIRSLVGTLGQVSSSDGSAKINLSAPGRWIAIFPQELPHDVEVSMDVEMDPRYENGFGVICRWSEANGGYALWYVSDYVVTSPFEMDENGTPVYYGASAEYATTQWADLLTGTKRHLTIRCQGPLVKMYINGQIVSSHDIQHFPMERHSNKAGLMVGLMFRTLVPEGASVTIDNLVISSGSLLLTPVPRPTP